MQTFRSQILWLGAAPAIATIEAFRSRRFELKCTVSPEDADFDSSYCAIFAFDGENKGQSIGVFRRFLPEVLIHGLHPIAWIEADYIPLILGIAQEYPPSSRVRFRDASTVNIMDLVEDARDGELAPGRGANRELMITGEALSQECERLLRRSFNDCDAVDLRPLTEGKSGANVFHALARRAPGVGGELPLPYLVKFDELQYAEKEYRAYKEFVEGHIPFSQRPNLDSTRCLFGAAKGVLVGDYVQGAVSLAEVASRLEGRSTIYSLFDDALLSWRRQATITGASFDGCILDCLPCGIKPEEVPSFITEHAHSLGLRATPVDLCDRLRALDANHYVTGIVHGDLHPGNVMVRFGEAILIDFSFCRDQGALVADLASLEVGLAFTSAAKLVEKGAVEVDSESFTAWKDEVQELFKFDHINHAPYSEDQRAKFSWLWERCRQMRAMARLLNASPQAYGSALAAYLIRRARLGGGAGENINTSAMALVIAEMLIIGLESAGGV